MYRAAASRLRALKGRVGTLGAAQYATSSPAATRPSALGFLGWLTGERGNSLPPLDFPLPGVALPPALPDYVEPAKLKSKTLANGVRIVSEASTSPAASIGLYIDCGSSYETPYTRGATHLLERMAYKTTRNRSHLRIVREVEAIGGHVGASASREQMGYTFDAIKIHVPEMVELLIDCVRNPVFLDWEVSEELKKVKDEVAELPKNPQGLLLEAIHSAGYEGALANPLLATESAISILNGTTLQEFVAEHYTAPRMVLAASGVDLEELASVAEPLLSDLPSVSNVVPPKSVYVGGDYRRQAESEFTHFALAFEVPGGWLKEKDAITLTVLQILMGGGGSFSAGGPGKGMHSRLYVRVLNQYQQANTFMAFNSIFNKTGLFGIYASTGPEFAQKAVDIAVGEMKSIATPGQVSEVELNRAKEATKAAILMNLESRMVVTEDIGRQFLTYGERKPLEKFLKMVDEVTLDDISKLGHTMISSPITVAAYGDVLNFPSYDTISNKFK